MRHPFLAVLAGLLLLSAASADSFPNLALKIDDGTLTLHSLRGKVVYVDYWASWCVPCRQSFPWMNQMHARYADRGLVIVAVNVDKEAPEAKRFLSRYPARFIVAYDADGVTAKALDLQGLPSSFLIDRNGELVANHLGFYESRKNDLEKQIKALLAR
jgi:cytochrome c biogenesis protein CcmG, thiol:disulfide interchange protein DsbE